MEVYLDNSATTQVFPEVAELMTKIMCKDYGNPSSMHLKGVEGERYIRYARETMANLLKVNEKEIFFTSGGTESDNLALVGCAMANSRAGRHIITTSIEHPAVLQACNYLEQQGFEITYLPVDGNGRVQMEALRTAVRPDTILVSVMHTNNEIGSLQPIEEIGSFLKRTNPNILFHVDAVQGFGKSYIYPKKMNIDLLSASGHKVHGPKGVGILYISERVKIKPILWGGGQQKNMRSGTENVPGAAGFAKAAEMVYAHMEDDRIRLYGMKKAFIKGVRQIEDVQVNGLTGQDSAPHVVSVSVRGVKSEVLLHALEDRGIYVSAGSACAARKPQSSATLKAIGLEKELADSTIRFSFSVYTTMEQIDYTLQAMYDIIPMLRKYTRR